MSYLAHLNLNYLRIFLVVYRTKSMTLAAKELHLTQSGVSQQIKSLEETLGITLFDRINRRIVPTAEADILFEECSRRLDDLELTLVNISKRKQEVSGKVSIGFPPIFGSHILVPQIAMFSKIYPSVTFELPIESASEITAHLKEGRLDFAFVDSFSKDPQLKTEEVFCEHLEMFAHRSILERFEPFSFEFNDFRKLPFVAYVEGEPLLRKWFRVNFDMVPQELNTIATVMDCQAVTKMVSEGMAVGLLPEKFHPDLYQNKNIIKLQMEAKAPVRNTIYLSYLVKKKMDRAATECFLFLKNNLLQSELQKQRQK